jgi:hypothetical protein
LKSLKQNWFAALKLFFFIKRTFPSFVCPLARTDYDWQMNRPKTNSKLKTMISRILGLGQLQLTTIIKVSKETNLIEVFSTFYYIHSFSLSWECV